MDFGAASRLHKARRRAVLAFAICVNCGGAIAQGGPFVPSARPRIQDPGSCPEREGAIFADGAGKIIAFLDRAEAQSLRLRTEMLLRGLSEPALRDNPRAVIEVVRPQGLSREVAVVPDGMAVVIGEAVEFDGGYWSADNSCVFVPNLIRKQPATG